MNIKNNVKSGIKWSTISSIYNSFGQLLKIGILTRLLEKSDFGAMAIVLVVFRLVQVIMDLGVTTIILHKQDLSKKQLSSLFYFNIIFSLTSYCVLFLSSEMISNLFNEESLSSYIKITSLALLFGILGKIFKTTAQKELKFKLMAIIESVSTTISIITAILLAYNNYGIYSLIYSLIIYYFIENIIYFLIGLKEKSLSLYFSFVEIKNLLSIGIYQFGGELINFLTKDFDILVIGKFFNLEILGAYSLIKELCYKPFRITFPIIYKVATPVLSKYQKKKDDLKKYFLLLNKYIVSIYVFIPIFSVIFSKWIIIIVFGEKLIEFVSLFNILIFHVYFRSIGSSIGSLIVSTGKTKLGMFWSISLLVIYPVPIFIGSFISIYTVAGLLTFVSVIIYFPLWNFLIKKLIDVSLRDYLSSFIPNPLLVINTLKKEIKNG